MVKLTFTFDDETVAILRRIATRLQRAQSAIVREAIREYEPHAGKLTEEESRSRLLAFDRLIAKIPARPLHEVDAESGRIRRSRRRGWHSKSDLR